MSSSLEPHGLQHTKLSCPSLSLEFAQTHVHWVGDPTISSSVVPFSSCPQSFPASGSFPMSQLFASGGQNIGVSASALVLAVNTQDWFPLALTGLTSVQSKGLSRVFSSTTVQRHQFFSTQAFFYCATLTSMHDHRKNHSLDQMDFCWQSNISAFQYAIQVGHNFPSKE